MVKLIKKGQQGMQVIPSLDNPYNISIYLEKDPLPEDYVAPKNIGKLGYIDITPELRMDLTTLLLNERLSTYKPTKELLISSEGITHPFNWGEATTALPILLAGAPFILEGLKAAGATILANPIGTSVELGKDILAYAAADAASQGITGLGVAGNFNKVLNLPEGHPVGELGGFTVTSLLRRPLEKAGVATYKVIRGTILPEYALSLAMNLTLWKPYVSRVIGENGKIRLRLPSHSNEMPREIVLEPQGNNKFYVHVRTWNDVEGKVPANLTPREIGYLYESLYDELPEGAEILFPKSGPGNYATRGTVAGLQRLTRDPRFSKGSPGTLQYLDKDGSIKEFNGTSFIKTSQKSNNILYKSLIPQYDTPVWTPVTKNYFNHINNRINIVENDGWVDLQIVDGSGDVVGQLSISDLTPNGHVYVDNIVSNVPGGSGVLYNAALEYNMRKYGTAFKGISSGNLLGSPEHTMNVTKHFPHKVISNRGGHVWLSGFKFGPVRLLTDKSSYYPQLKLPLIPRKQPPLTGPELRGVPKGERNNFKDWN